jgi:outer membrane lipopolysaccharide assembly protein LptE/RlpB
MRALLVIVVLALTGCGGGVSGNIDVPNPFKVMPQGGIDPDLTTPESTP